MLTAIFQGSHESILQPGILQNLCEAPPRIRTMLLMNAIRDNMAHLGMVQHTQLDWGSGGSNHG